MLRSQLAHHEVRDARAHQHRVERFEVVDHIRQHGQHLVQSADSLLVFGADEFGNGARVLQVRSAVHSHRESLQSGKLATRQRGHGRRVDASGKPRPDLTVAQSLRD